MSHRPYETLSEKELETRIHTLLDESEGNIMAERVLTLLLQERSIRRAL